MAESGRLSSLLSSLWTTLIEYETPRLVKIHNRKVGLVRRLIQLCIILYVILYALWLQRGYQEFSRVHASVTTKIKGVVKSKLSSTNVELHLPYQDVYTRVWDVADYVVPPAENGAFFVATNVIITPNQTQGRCPEDHFDVKKTTCKPDIRRCSITPLFKLKLDRDKRRIVEEQLIHSQQRTKSDFEASSTTTTTKNFAATTTSSATSSATSDASTATSSATSGATSDMITSASVTRSGSTREIWLTTSKIMRNSSRLSNNDGQMTTIAKDMDETSTLRSTFTSQREEYSTKMSSSLTTSYAKLGFLKCRAKNNACPEGAVRFKAHGPLTGFCVPSDRPGAKEDVYACEIESWCPVEVDKLPLGKKEALMSEASEYTVFVKNSIAFPYFGPQYVRNNLIANNGRPCLFRIDDPKTEGCQIFRLGDLVQMAGGNFSKMAIKGGVVSLSIGWHCNLDWDFMTYCLPKYSFRILDDFGWNFRTARFHEEHRRTLYKMYGIKFIITVEGRGGKFNLKNTILNVGSGLALLGVTTVVCDFLLMYIKERGMIKQKKYDYVDHPKSSRHSQDCDLHRLSPLGQVQQNVEVQLHHEMHKEPSVNGARDGHCSPLATDALLSKENKDGEEDNDLYESVVEDNNTIHVVNNEN